MKPITRIAILLATAGLIGCASASDLKPGFVRGIDHRGYVKTSEGFGVVTRGCSDAHIWETVLDVVRTAKVSYWGRDLRLLILGADQAAGVIRAEDPPTVWKTGSFAGVFIHRLSENRRLIEVSAFWQTRMAVPASPWEEYLLERFRDRLPCVIPSDQASLTAG